MRTIQLEIICARPESNDSDTYKHLSEAQVTLQGECILTCVTELSLSCMVHLYHNLRLYKQLNETHTMCFSHF